MNSRYMQVKYYLYHNKIDELIDYAAKNSISQKAIERLAIRYTQEGRKL